MTLKTFNNILIVDDIPNNLEVLEQLFADSPFHLIQAPSGKRALELALEQDFDLMILDVRMPEMDGFELATLLRSRKKMRYVPIIFLTAGETDEDGVIRGYLSGAVDFLQKPYHPEILKAKCKILIELENNRKQLLRANEALQAENEARRTAEKALIAYRDELEQRVKERTATLDHKNCELMTQIEERKHAEALLVHLKERAESAVRAKDIFLANLSHELRTPLNAVIGFTELMLEPDFQKSTSDSCENLKRIQKAGRHLLELINDLLSFSMIETGGVALERQPLKFVETLTGALNLIMTQAQEKSIEVHSELSDVGTVYADRTRLMQVMVNLLGNAVKFTNVGGTIGIRCQETDSEIVVTVWDTGIGIPSDKISEIFIEFKQIEEELSRRYGGVGLGLAIARRLIEKMNGRIWVTSMEGHGSQFFVAFPTSIRTAPIDSVVTVGKQVQTGVISPLS